MGWYKSCCPAARLIHLVEDVWSGQALALTACWQLPFGLHSGWHCGLTQDLLPSCALGPLDGWSLVTVSGLGRCLGRQHANNYRSVATLGGATESDGLMQDLLLGWVFNKFGPHGGQCQVGAGAWIDTMQAVSVWSPHWVARWTDAGLAAWLTSFGLTACREYLL